MSATHRRMLFLLVIVVISLPVNTADAYVKLGGYWGGGEANSLTYWLDASVTQTGYTSYAQHGSTAWNSSPYINVAQTTSSTNANIKWYASTIDLGDFYADTMNYDNSYPCLACEYDTSTIRINVSSFKSLDTNRMKETTAHEVGHSLGLDHEDDVPAIMISGPGWLYGTYPVQDDFNGITDIYDGV